MFIDELTEMRQRVSVQVRELSRESSRSQSGVAALRIVERQKVDYDGGSPSGFRSGVRDAFLYAVCNRERAVLLLQPVVRAAWN